MRSSSERGRRAPPRPPSSPRAARACSSSRRTGFRGRRSAESSFRRRRSPRSTASGRGRRSRRRSPSGSKKARSTCPTGAAVPFRLPAPALGISRRRLDALLAARAAAAGRAGALRARCAIAALPGRDFACACWQEGRRRGDGRPRRRRGLGALGRARPASRPPLPAAGPLLRLEPRVRRRGAALGRQGSPLSLSGRLLRPVARRGSGGEPRRRRLGGGAPALERRLGRRAAPRPREQPRARPGPGLALARSGLSRNRPRRLHGEASRRERRPDGGRRRGCPRSVLRPGTGGGARVRNPRRRHGVGVPRRADRPRGRRGRVRPRVAAPIRPPLRVERGPALAHPGPALGSVAARLAGADRAALGFGIGDPAHRGGDGPS